MLQFECPHCKNRLEIDDSLAGAEAACPLCEGALVVPTASTVAPEAVIAEEETAVSPLTVSTSPSGDYFYTSSNRFLPGRLLAGLAVGTFLMLILSLIYAYAISYIPLIYINIVLCFGFGIVIGFLASLLSFVVRNRNRAIAWLCAIALTGLALWFSWGFWVSTLTDELSLFGDFLAYMNPIAILLVAIEVTGVEEYMNIGKLFGPRGLPITGFGLALLWLLEAGMIAVTALWTFSKNSRNLSFCEECKNWTETIHTSSHLLMVEDEEAFRETLASGDFDELLALRVVPNDDHFTTIAINSCGCGQTFLLTVNDVVISYDDKGNPSTTERPFVNGLYITRQTAQELIRRKP